MIDPSKIFLRIGSHIIEIADIRRIELIEESASNKLANLKLHLKSGDILLLQATEAEINEMYG